MTQPAPLPQKPALFWLFWALHAFYITTPAVVGWTQAPEYLSLYNEMNIPLSPLGQGIFFCLTNPLVLFLIVAAILWADFNVLTNALRPDSTKRLIVTGLLLFAALTFLPAFVALALYWPLLHP